MLFDKLYYVTTAVMLKQRGSQRTRRMLPGTLLIRFPAQDNLKRIAYVELSSLKVVRFNKKRVKKGFIVEIKDKKSQAKAEELFKVYSALHLL